MCVILDTIELKLLLCGCHLLSQVACLHAVTRVENGGEENIQFITLDNAALFFLGRGFSATELVSVLERRQK